MLFKFNLSFISINILSASYFHQLCRLNANLKLLVSLFVSQLLENIDYERSIASSLTQLALLEYIGPALTMPALISLYGCQICMKRHSPWGISIHIQFQNGSYLALFKDSRSARDLCWTFALGLRVAELQNEV